MLVFSKQSNRDLASILAGLFAFRIGDAMDPALTEEHACAIYDEIADHIATIPSLSIHRANNLTDPESFGSYVYSYKRNNTNWYAFYDIVGEEYIVKRITNNWNLPAL